MSEFTEWARRFEFKLAGEWDYEKRMLTSKEVPLDPPRCMYPVKEGPHKVAHLAEAHHRSVDGYPACKQHSRKSIRPAWRGYVEGA